MKVKIAAVALIGFAAIGAFHSTIRAQQTAPAQPPSAAPPPDAAAPGAQAPAAPMASRARTVWDAVYSEEQARKGDALYGQYCANCHLPDMAGADLAPPLVGGTFGANWSGLPLGDLFERIRLTMPSDDPGKLSRQQNADILAHMLAVNGFPAGKTALAQETEVLNAITFEAQKP